MPGSSGNKSLCAARLAARRSRIATTRITRRKKVQTRLVFPTHESACAMCWWRCRNKQTMQFTRFVLLLLMRVVQEEGEGKKRLAHSNTHHQAQPSANRYLSYLPTKLPVRLRWGRLVSRGPRLQVSSTSVASYYGQTPPLQRLASIGSWLAVSPPPGCPPTLLRHFCASRAALRP